MALNLLARGATVLRDVVAPAEVVVGSGGVFVILTREDGDRADLRAHVRDVRAVLDGAGLCAMPAEGLLCTGFGEPIRRHGDILVGDLDAVNLMLLLASDNTRFGPGTVRRAVAALAPAPVVEAPPWIATVAEPEPEPEPALEPHLHPPVARATARGLA